MQIQGKRKCELEVENESALEIKIWMVEIRDGGPWEARVMELGRGGPSGSEKEATLSPPPRPGRAGVPAGPDTCSGQTENPPCL